jgi:peptidoglycan/xylan/chitin deacetylase (PgdA/CDA1 family)
VRRWVAGVAYGLGVTQAVTRAGDRWRVLRRGRTFSIGPRRRDPFLILLYHRVNRVADPFSIERTTPEAFRGQMAHLARNFSVMPLGEIAGRLRSGKALPPRAVAITFDDGYADNYTEAFPILRALGLPATVFLTTGCIGTGESLWFDRVLRAFQRTERDTATLPGGEEATGMRDPALRARMSIRALYALMRLPDAERVEAVTGLERQLLDGGAATPASDMLDWDQIRAMAAGGITFGAHTVNHPILARLPLEDAEREIVASKRRIEEETGRGVDLFAYPVGRRSDYSPEVIARVVGVGFQAAVTTTPGANRRGDDPFLLRRVKPLGEDVPSFALGLGAHYLTEWRSVG